METASVACCAAFGAVVGAQVLRHKLIQLWQADPLSNESLVERIPNVFRKSPYFKDILIAVECSMEAGRNISDQFTQTQSNKKVESKGTIDFVTSTDKANEALIFEKLRKYFPDYQFIGEVDKVVIKNESV